MEILVSDKKQTATTPNNISFYEREKELDEILLQQEEKIKKSKNSPFTRWTQFNNERTKEWIWLMLNYPKASAILLFLVDQMDHYNAVMCSYQVLQEVFNTSQSTVTRSIKILKDNGFIAVIKSGTSNIYAINDDIYWKSYGNNKKYSKFPANIVLSLSEQDVDYQAKFNKVKSSKVKEVVSRTDN